MEPIKKKKIVQKKGKFYSETERHAIIRELLKNQWTKQYAWELYTGEPEERGQLTRWMRKLGYLKEIKHKQYLPVFKVGRIKMKRKPTEKPSDDFELRQLRQRVSELEKELKEAQMKAIAMSTMVDVAEEMFKIPIRKKLNTKPSKS